MRCVNLCEMKSKFNFTLKKNKKIHVLSKIHRYKDCASHLKISTNCGVNISYIKCFCVCVCAPTDSGLL